MIFRLNYKAGILVLFIRLVFRLYLILFTNTCAACTCYLYKL